ncbi:MAG: DUF11 domain-containing protein [Sarcina sp.]
MVNPILSIFAKTKEYAVVVGNIVNYQIYIINNGNINLRNVKVFDTLNKNLEFITGSVKINGKKISCENITAGIILGEIRVDDEFIIEFKAKVVDAVTKEICNQTIATYVYDAQGINQFDQSLSNIVKLPVVYIHLSLVKNADEKFTVLKDIIEYTVIITNDGDVEAKNVIFKDKLSKYVCLVEGSFKVNNRRVNSIELEKGVFIGDIEVNDKIIISYKVEVIAAACNDRLINLASAIFEYQIDNLSAGVIEVSQEELKHVIDMGISTFKQLSIEEEFVVPMNKPNIAEINELIGTINIFKYHLIETPKITSQENQILTGHKLIVSAYLNIMIKYTALDEEQSVHSMNYKILFSTFIVMPENYNISSKIDVKGIVEDMYSNTYDERKIFINTTGLINVKIIDY